MKEKLTISEVAKIMNLSTHQVRYYEEKGVITPEKDEENGYRLYGLKEVYMLSHIMLLRKLNISVPDIRKGFADDSGQVITDLLRKSETDLQQQIDELVLLKKKTHSLLIQHDDFMKNRDQYRIKTFDKRYLTEVFSLVYDQNITERKILDQLPTGPDNMIEQNMFELYDEKQVVYCVESADSENHSLVLKAGQYLCYSFLTTGEGDFEEQINTFFAYGKREKLKMCGKLIAIENTMLSIFNNRGIVYDLQVQLK